eukprot:scaffold3051_cov419-Prasinococcus_capsulatus_cf.AAC.4
MFKSSWLLPPLSYTRDRAQQQGPSGRPQGRGHSLCIAEGAWAGSPSEQSRQRPGARGAPALAYPRAARRRRAPSPPRRTSVRSG